MKILIVDDDPVTMSALAELLISDDTVVDHAANGPAALAMLKVMNPDVIVMDWCMPMMSGASLVKLIRGNDRLKVTPIIVLTALSSSEIDEEIGAVGEMAQPISVVQKPATINEIKQKIRDLSRVSV